MNNCALPIDITQANLLIWVSILNFGKNRTKFHESDDNWVNECGLLFLILSKLKSYF